MLEASVSRPLPEEVSSVSPPLTRTCFASTKYWHADASLFCGRADCQMAIGYVVERERITCAHRTGLQPYSLRWLGTFRSPKVVGSLNKNHSPSSMPITQFVIGHLVRIANSSSACLPQSSSRSRPPTEVLWPAILAFAELAPSVLALMLHLRTLGQLLPIPAVGF